MTTSIEHWPQLKKSPAIPLLLIAAINFAWFFLFDNVGTIVGAATGSDGYKEIAENLVRGNGLRFSQDLRSTIEFGYMKREPIYPLLLSVILRLTGTLSPAVLSLIHTSLSLVSCYLIYRLGRKLFGASTGRLASFIYALHPISFWYSPQFASEIVAMTAMLFCLFLTERFFTEPTRLKAAQVGLSVGIATLTKSACVMLLPVIVLFALIKWRKELRRFLSFAFIIVFIHLSIFSFWVVRNYSISGEIVPFTTNSGGVFFIGNRVVEQFDVTKLTAEEPAAEVAAQDLYRSVQDEIVAKVPHISLASLEAQTDKQLIALARQVLLERPFFAVRKFLCGMAFIWFLSDTTAKSWGWMLFQMPLIAVVLITLCRQRQWNFIQSFLLCVAVAYIVPYALLLALARYSMPIVPIVILFSSYGLVSILKPAANRQELTAPRSLLA